jgi:Stress responsive A/B Barrel Domain
VIRHIVVVSVARDFQDELPGLIERLEALPGQIGEIEALAVGRPLNATAFDAALTVDVADENALQAYREHPAHVPVVEGLRRIAEEIVVADITV